MLFHHLDTWSNFDEKIAKVVKKFKGFDIMKKTYFTSEVATETVDKKKVVKVPEEVKLPPIEKTVPKEEVKVADAPAETKSNVVEADQNKNNDAQPKNPKPSQAKKPP